MVDFKLMILFKKMQKSFVERGYLWSPVSSK